MTGGRARAGRGRARGRWPRRSAPASAWCTSRPTADTITVTAQFDSAAGLYVDNTVAVLGMPVGKVTEITPKGGYVEVEFTVDRDVKIPADAQAVTISNSILTDRQIELTPPYRDGPTLQDHATIGLTRTRTPVEFARVLDVLDKLSMSLEGDGNGNGPMADVVNASAAIADGNGEQMKDALGELSKALRLSRRRRRVTRDQLTTIIRNVSSLFEAAAGQRRHAERVRLPPCASSARSWPTRTSAAAPPAKARTRAPPAR